jgi:hypothetical protein
MRTDLRKQHAKLLAVMFLAGLTACTSLSTDTVKVQNSSSIPSSATDFIKDYRQWTRVNPVPAVFHSRIAVMCAPATQHIQMEAGNPHRDKFITVYVNETGTEAMMQDRRPHFPQGSVIVKEKLPSKDSSSPELLTVMLKREAGYNRENGDWEYIALDGAGKEVQERGRLQNCQACHQMAKDSDYVYRNYLPPDVRTKLK